MVPAGADRSPAVSDGGGGCKIGYCWAPGVHPRMVLLLSYLWNSTRTDAPSGSLGRGPGSSELTETVEKSFLPDE